MVNYKDYKTERVVDANNKYDAIKKLKVSQAYGRYWIGLETPNKIK